MAMLPVLLERATCLLPAIYQEAIENTVFEILRKLKLATLVIIHVKNEHPIGSKITPGVCCITKRVTTIPLSGDSYSALL